MIRINELIHPVATLSTGKRTTAYKRSLRLRNDTPNAQVTRTLKAIRSLISDKPENQLPKKKVKQQLGIEQSWIEIHKHSKGHGQKDNDRPMLRPHEVSRKIKQLAVEGKLDDAINYVSNLPLKALNVQAWNTLMWEVNRAGRYGLAWQLYNTMKKKGFEPSVYTYKTMLSGLSRIDDFNTHSLALERAQKLYQSFIQYTSKLQKEHPSHPELYPIPIHFYMVILAKAGRRQQMWNAFYAMDKEGSMAPNAVTFASMLQYLDWWPAGETMPQSEWNQKVASEAVLLWRLMLDASKGSPGFEIDSYALAAVLRNLAKGAAMEHELGLKIAQEYLGYPVLESTTKPSQTPCVSNTYTLQATLELCRLANKPQLVISITQQVMKMDEENPILDIHHMDQFFTAYVNLASAEGSLREVKPEESKDTPPKPGRTVLSRQAVSSLQWLLSHAAEYFSVDRGKEEHRRYLWPTLHTYNIILAICRECKDWESTKVVLETMTRHKVTPVSNTEPSKPDIDAPFFSLLSKEKEGSSWQRRQFFRPVAESLFNILRCAYDYALMHNKPSIAHECLSTITSLGGTNLLLESYNNPLKIIRDLKKHPSSRNRVAQLDATITWEEERKKYWTVRAAAVVPALFSMATKSGGWNREEYKKAADLKSAATAILNSVRTQGKEAKEPEGI